MSQGTFVGRQPIVDRDQHVVAYELLFRASRNAEVAEFGEVSRAFVALLRAAPALQAGRHLFHCPMAQGFPKWVQTTEKMANPYMGKAMLECGSERPW